MAAFAGPDRRHDDFGSVLYRSIREVCHDMRQPIATVGALAEAALTHPDLPGEVVRRLRHIVDETQMLADLTQRIVSTGLLAMPVNPADLLADVVDRAALTFAGVLRVSVEPRPALVADPVALRRVIANVLENAIRATGPQGVILVALVGDDRWTVVEVGDSGPGFGAACPGAASLGLTIAERLMQAHGGHIEFGRSELGGALVRLVLPARLSGN
ncbi:MAG TPA: HAMP domain-containing sensor histidine kinase [Candidatus Dormibacteraeota bacterium]|jgi:signal transduction histidine kinase